MLAHPKVAVMQSWKRMLAWTVAIIGGAVVLCLGIIGPCWSAWLFDGVLLGTCPAGTVRPVVSASAEQLGRDIDGTVQIAVAGFYVERNGRQVQSTPVRRFDTRFTLVDPAGKESPLKAAKWLDSYGFAQRARIRLPKGPDGDWILRVTADSPAGESTTDLKLPLYVPALAHVLTDAPLYKPGQTLRFRAVLLDEGSLAPVEDRPGVWTVVDPQGEVMLEEKARTGKFGVAASTFPLDAEAEPGNYTIRFTSGSATHERVVEVRMFQLPRFTVEAKSERMWWRSGDIPVVSGTARYSSGAPVANASVQVRASSSGEWPPPPDWLAERTLATDAGGRFRIALPVVPADLNGQATVTFRFVATDETGDTAGGAASLLFASDFIAASAVTELADGLVPGANNRMYLRVTRPDGAPLPGATIRVSRDGVPGDVPMESVADADGVARFQLDPGQPITVVVPPQPVRVTPRAVETRVRVDAVSDLVAGTAGDVAADSVAARWASAAQSCGMYGRAGTAERVEAAVRVDAGGRVTVLDVRAEGEENALTRCFGDRIRATGARPGRDRVWLVTFAVPDPELPWVEASATTILGDDAGMAGAASDAMRLARPCVTGVQEPLNHPTMWLWSVAKGSRSVSLTPVRSEAGGLLDPAAAACVTRAVNSVVLADPAEAKATGTLFVSAAVPPSILPTQPQATTFPGYALRVSALIGGEPQGETVLRMRPGAIPALRLRFSEVLAEPGAKIDFVALRSEEFTGDLPEKLWLMQGNAKILEFPVKDRKGSFTLPADAHGFYTVTHLDANAKLYVRERRKLDIALTPDRSTYRPGEIATLTVTTTGTSGPVPAGVTLSGVDSTFSALAALPNPDSFSDVTPHATTDVPAFAFLDARALETGQIRGENAAQATVLRVTSLPARPAGHERVNATAGATFDSDGELTDAFYTLYAAARAEVRAWEGRAAKDEVLTAKEMVALWEKTLVATPARDPFDNPLHLSALPADLLALVNPRFMVSDGARLPEDVENWPQYVAKEAP